MFLEKLNNKLETQIRAALPQQKEKLSRLSEMFGDDTGSRRYLWTLKVQKSINDPFTLVMIGTGIICLETMAEAQRLGQSLLDSKQINDFRPVRVFKGEF